MHKDTIIADAKGLADGSAKLLSLKKTVIQLQAILKSPSSLTPSHFNTLKILQSYVSIIIKPSTKDIGAALR